MVYSEVLVLGILLSLAFSGLTGISPGGLIVCGYLALALNSPIRLLITVLVALATFGLYRLISRFTILYGKRRFAVTVILSVLLGWCVTLLPFPGTNLGIAGYLIPGIIAKECDRQGLVKTFAGMVIVTGALAMVCLLLGIRLF